MVTGEEAGRGTAMGGVGQMMGGMDLEAMDTAVAMVIQMQGMDPDLALGISPLRLLLRILNNTHMVSDFSRSLALLLSCSRSRFFFLGYFPFSTEFSLDPLNDSYFRLICMPEMGGGMAEAHTQTAAPLSQASPEMGMPSYDLSSAPSTIRRDPRLYHPYAR